MVPSFPGSSSLLSYIRWEPIKTLPSKMHGPSSNRIAISRFFKTAKKRIVFLLFLHRAKERIAILALFMKEWRVNCSSLLFFMSKKERGAKGKTKNWSFCSLFSKSQELFLHGAKKQIAQGCSFSKSESLKVALFSETKKKLLFLRKSKKRSLKIPLFFQRAKEQIVHSRSFWNEKKSESLLVTLFQLANRTRV